MNLSLIILILAFLIDIEGAIANDKIGLAHMIPDSWILAVKAWDSFLLYCGTSLIGLLAAPGAFRSRIMQGVPAAIVLLALLFQPAPARASDVAATAAPLVVPTTIKLPKSANLFSQPYTLTACGGYFGVNTMGSSSSVQGATVAPGTQVVQGAIGGTLGYGCPINAQNGSFWFAEVLVDVNNLNGAANGLSLSGPASFVERFGVGSPLTSMLPSIFGQQASASSGPAVPNLPVLPSGVTAGPGNPYAFVALHQDDISYQVGLAQNQQWLLSFGVGLGIRYRLSNAIVADTFAEYQTASTSTICVGPLGNAGCAGRGQGARVGVQFLY